MATITANTSSNNWNTNAAWSGGAQPTAADDVIIPTGATVTIPSATTVVCRSLSVTGTGTIVFTAGTSVLTIGSSTPGAGNVALSIANTATVTLTASDGLINFISTSSTQQTITTGGKTMPSITINGVGSSYVLGDALTMVTTGVVTTFSITAGTFNTANFSMTLLIFNSANNGSARTITLGSSAIIVARNATAMTWDPTNLTMTPNTAVITATASATINVAGTNMNGTSIIFVGGGTVSMQNGGTWNNVTVTGTAAKTGALQVVTAGFTCTGTFTCNGNSVINRVLVFSNIRGSSRTITAAAVSISNTDFMDTTAAGASAPWNLANITGGSGDCGGNSNITFTSPATQTATGTASFVWSTHSWTTRVPLPQDSVIIPNAFIAGRTISVDMPRLGKDITVTATGSPIWQQASASELYGSLTFATGMTTSTANSLTFAGRGNHTITSNNVSYANVPVVNGPGGTYSFQDAFTTTQSLTLTSGTLATNNQTVTCLQFVSTGSITRVLTLGSTTFNLTSTAAVTIWNVASTGLATSATSSTIVISAASANTRTFVGGDQSYGELRYTVASSTGILAISGTNSFVTISVSGGVRTLRLPRSVNTTVRNFNVFGTAGNLVIIDSDITGNTAFISQPIGNLMSNDYLNIRDLTVRQPYKFFAGANSTSTSNNSNISFSAPSSAPYIFQEAAPAQVSGTSVTATLTQAATAGNLLIAMHSTTTGGTPITTPTGWTLAKLSQHLTSTSAAVYYKVAVGNETGVTITNTSSTTLNLLVFEVAGWQGTPTQDVTDGSTVSSATSLSTAGTSPTNAVPAFAVAGISTNANPGTMSVSDSYQLSRTSTSNAVSFWGVKPLTAAASQAPTFSWVTARQGASVLAVFKDAPIVATSGSFLPFF